MSTWTPADWIELVKVVFYGITILCVPAATFFTMMSAARAKRAEDSSLRNAASIQAVSTNVDRLEKNTNSISERNQAIAMKLGIADGIAQERASVLANSNAGAALPGTSPLPVADERTAAASERSAAATERVADAAEEVGAASRKP